MKVSVIMRTYNRAYCIGEALDSVLRQTYRNFEVVVVDDGSTDNTQEIVSSFQNDNIRYIRHDHNRGVSVAGNTGIKAATGDAIAHLDSDDLWKPEMLNSLVDFLNRHPEVGAVFCGVQLIRNGEPPSSIASLMEAFPKLLALHTQLKSDDIVFSNREMYLCLLEEVPIKPSAALIRRSVVDHIGGYNESMVSGEDWELYLRISKYYQFGYINRQLTTMRILGDSTLSKFLEQDKISLHQLAITEKETLRGDREAIRVVNRGISRHCKDLGWIYLQSGRQMKAISTYFRGFAETRQTLFLIRAALALLPLSLRNLVADWLRFVT